MKRRPRARRARRLGILGISLAMMFACATSRPSMQRFWAVETPNFEIMSSFDADATRALARDLELFHAGVLRALGLEETPPRYARTRVLAFDDRSPGRPFAVRGQASVLVPGVDRGTLVFRVPGDWQERASWALKTEYAHRLIRSRAIHPLPLWLEEGLAQVAGAATIRDGQVWLGALVGSHLREVRDWRRSSLAPLIQKTDLSQTSDPGREGFRAESWALVHTLTFDARAGARAREFPASFWRSWDERAGSDPGAVVNEVLGGDGTSWGDRVQSHLEAKDFALRVVRPRGWNLDAIELRGVSRAEAAMRLGELALALDRPRLAARQFDEALDEDPGSALARAGLAIARSGRFEDAEREALRAIESAPDDARILRWVGRGYLEGARQTSDSRERMRRLTVARDRLLESLALDPESARAYLDLARVALERGDDPRDVAARIDAAESLRPGALEIGLVAARLELRRGRAAAARFRARDVASRTTWPAHRKEAAGLLRETGETTAGYSGDHMKRSPTPNR